MLREREAEKQEKIEEKGKEGRLTQCRERKVILEKE